MENSSLEIIEQLYQIVAEAWGVPLGNEKCIIEREKVLSLLDELKSGLPVELAEARRLVNSRNEFINSARKEAEAMRAQAEEQSRRLVDEKEIMRTARQRAADMVASAEHRSRELMRVASGFLDDALRRTEEAVSASLEEVRTARDGFRSAMGGAPSAGETGEESGEEPDAPEEIVPDIH